MRSCSPNKRAAWAALALVAALLIPAASAPALAQIPSAASAPAAPAAAVADPERNPLTCPTKDFHLDTALPKGAQPEVFLDPSTLWQPRGGEIKMVIRQWPSAMSQGSFVVCFRWRHLDGFKGKIMATPVPVRILSTDAQQIVIAAIVPSLPASPPRLWGLFADMDDVLNPNVEPHYGDYTAFNGVPTADVLLRVHDVDGNHLDVQLQVGITSRTIATVFTVLLASLTLFSLYKIRWVEDRFPDVNFLLRLISSPDGRASLSQLQVLIWSLVVGGGAIYVMTLTGELINVTSGTLIMLGISGGAALTAEIKTRSGAGAAPTAAPEPPPAPAFAEPPPPAPTTTPAETTFRRPHWADVVTDGTGTEIDVTRVQMLFFTVITALFVTIKIVTSYTIPEIPEGFLVLMGISNGVYVSKKFI